MNLSFLNYNNYFNRLLKRLDTPEEYLEYECETVYSANFNPANGINTEVIVNIDDDIKPDYMIAWENYAECASRWYVLESTRVRGGQYKMTLYRDMVADYYNIIKEADCHIYKGYVSDASPLIHNSENISFNEIKRGEYLLKNTNIGSPWLIAYLSRFDGENNYNTFKGTFGELSSTITADYSLDSIVNFKYYKYIHNSPYENLAQTTYSHYNDVKIGIPYKDLSTQNYKIIGVYYGGDLWDENVSSANVYTTNSAHTYFTSESGRAMAQQAIYSFYDKIAYDNEGLPYNTLTNWGIYEGSVELSALNNKIIYDSTLKQYYKIKVIYEEEAAAASTYINSTVDFAKTAYDTIVAETGGNWTIPNEAQRYIKIQSVGNKVHTYLEIYRVSETSGNNYNFTSGFYTEDAPYEIIAAPLYDHIFQDENNNTINHVGETALKWFLHLGESIAAGLVYDIQLVPYISFDSNSLLNQNYVTCYKGSSATAASTSAIAIRLPLAAYSYKINVPKNLPITASKKVSGHCDKYRLVAPNGSNSFEFSIAKNGGLRYLEADVTLMPYNPYIKINPYWEEMYGGDYNDYRGLICGGDYSLPIVNDTWTTYQINNKYYQDIFDRNISSLELQNNISNENAIWSAIAGTATGALSGATTGAVLGGGVGAIVGGVAGAGTSAIAGVTDYKNQVKLQQEQLSLQKDLQSYNLQTIQAQPHTLTRTTAYNINNKYFPYIEYYTCTDEEKELFNNMLKYQGMTINTIGKIADYVCGGDTLTYIKADLIRIDIEQDYNAVTALRRELNIGIYIQGDYK